MVLVCKIDMVLQVALPAINLHLPIKQLVLIISMLLLPLINGIEPQVEVREMLILIKVGSVKTQGACPNVGPGQRRSVLLLLKGNNTRTARKVKTTLTTRTNIVTPPPSHYGLGPPHRPTPNRYHHQKSN